MLEVKEVKLSNLADCSKVCVGSSLPPGMDAFAAVDMQRAKLAFFRQAKGAGAAARVAYRDGAPVGLLEWYPVEASPTPVAGQDIFVVNCARVADRAARGEILAELVRSAEEAWSKRAGVAALGRNRSWEEFGFEVVEKKKAPERDEGMLTLYLKKFRPEASATLLDPVRPPKPDAGKVRVDLYSSDRCPWNGFVLDLVKKACAKYGKPVQILEHDCRQRAGVEKNGVGGGIAINGEFRMLLRPHLMPDERGIHKMLDLA